MFFIFNAARILSSCLSHVSTLYVPPKNAPPAPRSNLLLNPLGTNTAETNYTGVCTGDDFDCYRPAQLSLLSALDGARPGTCVVVITGDAHYSDIKV
jgi:hypothetical protein